MRSPAVGCTPLKRSASGVSLPTVDEAARLRLSEWERESESERPCRKLVRSAVGDLSPSGAKKGAMAASAPIVGHTTFAKAVSASCCSARTAPGSEVPARSWSCAAS